MSRLLTLRELNPDKHISSIHDSAFSPFGRVLNPSGSGPMLDFSLQHFTDFTSPETCYTASDVEMEKYPVVEEISRTVFGEFEIQVGCCFGYNTRMNGMEFHKSSEVLGAATDMVLMFGLVQDIEIRDGVYTWDSSLTKIFFLPAGTMIELYATTLHLAPCRVSPDPFNAVIILPKGTNTPLETEVNEMLWMKNKWLVAHPDSPAAAKGSCVGIIGPNHEIQIIP
ncbi:MAG: DUF4867 family protein [Bacteroidetes bacterium]|nr:DUF4867 family protein [Bacteroidota bacterium]